VDHAPPIVGEQKENEEDLVPNGRSSVLGTCFVAMR
jgi:hypothetical protein